ncbi:MAG: site-2 protease family protein [Candidatus Bathyarchaeia archaeon]
MANDNNPYATPQPLTFRELYEIIDSEFHVEGFMLEFDIPIFSVKTRGPSKETFIRLVQKLNPYNLLPLLRRRYGGLVIQVLHKPTERPERGRNIPLILFLASVCTVSLSGYFNSHLWSEIFGENIILHSLYFTIALLGIVGLHEMGHKLTVAKRGLRATSPYFIPGPPYPMGFGTFGALIMQKDPPANRDQLFDIGFSGPVTGFIIALIVSSIALLGVRFVDQTLVSQLETQGVEVFELPSSLGLIILNHLIGVNASPGYVAVIPPIGIAGWIGFVVTFLNLLPAWQLDGGHIARAMFGERGHRYASLIGLAIAVATGFWFFALLILFFMGSRRSIELLDDVSPLSTSRKMLGVLAYIILVLSAVIFW